MDPICHTLVGGCLARTGLARRTGLGTATLVIAANLPDVDVLAIPLGLNLELRRGWTHGVLALVLWPVVLGLAMLAWDRLRRRASRPPVRFGALLWLAAAGVLTHPFLDFLNSYGMRWLMPFRDRWYYGDTLFIIDPWLWGLLGLALWASRRAEGRGAADPGRAPRVALGLATVYVGAMMLSTLAARAAIRREVGDKRFMATPAPAVPWRKEVVIDDGESYRLGRYVFGAVPALQVAAVVPKQGDPAAREAVMASRAGRAFLHWARFPAYTHRVVGDSVRVRVRDLRYAGPDTESWAAFEVTIPAERSAAGATHGR